MRIAIVEDEINEAQTLRESLREYFGCNEAEANIEHFDNPVVFLEKYKSDIFDIVFMDIEMPMMDGMTAAKKLREKDGTVVLVFVTNMAQFAVEGYGVNALDFVVKPIKRARLFSVLDKAVKHMALCDVRTVDIKAANSFVRLDVKRIMYVEVYRHRLYYHTVDGVFDAWGSLAEAENALPTDRFARCGSGYIVNLAFVKRVDGDDIYIGTDTVKISRSRKKEFLAKLVEFVGL